jgi:excisionase family DNA binding protein
MEETNVSNVIDLAARRPALTGSGRVTYTVGEVAGLLGMSRANTYVLLKSGDIPARRLGNRWIIPRHRFHQWLDADTEEAAR